MGPSDGYLVPIPEQTKILVGALHQISRPHGHAFLHRKPEKSYTSENRHKIRISAEVPLD